MVALQSLASVNLVLAINPEAWPVAVNSSVVLLKFVAKDQPGRFKAAVRVGHDAPRFVGRTGGGAFDLHDLIADRFPRLESRARDVHHGKWRVILLVGDDGGGAS